MKFSSPTITAALLLSSGVAVDAFMRPASLSASPQTISVPSTILSQAQSTTSLRSVVEEDTDSEASTNEPLTLGLVSKLPYREAKRQLEGMNLETSGTLSQMKDRLREQVNGGAGADGYNQRNHDDLTVTTQDIDEAFAKGGIDFSDESDPDFEFNDLIRETLEKAEMGHWKAATRKLKRLSRKFGKNSSEPRGVPQEIYDATLAACMDDRLHGARAAEPTRKILDQMVEQGYQITSKAVNYCVKNSLGDGPNGTHQGFGGIDTALAILATAETAAEPPAVESLTYEKLIAALARSGAIEDSLAMLRSLVVEKSETPTLSVFAKVAAGAVRTKTKENAEHVLTILAYAKAAGYDLDNIASTVEGRSVLASAVIASEIMDNVPLGLRLLAAASKAEGCAPDRGDDLVASSSSAAQRASTIIHRRAVNKAVQEESWKLAVKLIELMLNRSLRPSPSVWRNVVTCCAKAEKSRKAASLLFDWVQLWKSGRAEQPPLRVFNTVINACEICGEEDLTVDVLDSMKETHNTDGNLITFNIALKRLAKQGNIFACEGIIVGMLQSNIEPSVVSYTTAIASCVAGEKNSEVAEEWIKRMRSRRVAPNVITYNTALAACLDGTLEGTQRGSRLAAQMLADVQMQLAQLEESGEDVDSENNPVTDQYTRVAPNFYTKTLARQLMKQLKQNWVDGDIDRALAKTTVRTSLRAIVEFERTENAQKTQELETKAMSVEEDHVSATSQVEEDLEFSVAVTTHRAAAV